MRQPIAILCTLVLIFTVGLCWTHAAVNQQRDQVVLTETTLEGDKAASDGLTVTAINQYVHRLTWHTTLTTGAQNHTTTTFTTFNDTPDYGAAPTEYSGINLEYHFSTVLDTTTPPEQLEPIERVYRELFDETPQGRESEKVIRIRDYYDYYPLILSIELPAFRMYAFEGDVLPTDETEAAILTHYRTFFRLPVLEDEYLEISVRKGPSNAIGVGSGNTIDSDWFFCRTLTELTDDAMYFLFDAHSKEGKLVDTSLIPGGFGIYRQPYGYDPTTKENTIDPTELSTVFTLDPNIEPQALFYNNAYEQLQLLTVENGQIMLYIIDGATHHLLQKIAVGSLPENHGIWKNVFHDDYIVITTSDERIIVLAADDSGTFSLRFSLQCDMESPIGQIKLNFADTAWNGKQLAMVGHDGESADFLLAVVDASGIRYCGKYKSSLTTGNEGAYRYHVHPANEIPLTVDWND